MPKYLAIFAAVIIAGSGAVAAQTADQVLDQVMTPEQKLAVGVHKLTAPERQALVDFLVSTFNVGKQVGLQECGTGPAYQPPAQPRSPQPSGYYANTGGGHWVKEKIDSGRMILLEDGSLWEISSMDRLNTTLWLRITNITVIESDDCYPGFAHMLVNTDDGEKACAKLVGRR